MTFDTVKNIVTLGACALSLGQVSLGDAPLDHLKDIFEALFKGGEAAAKLHSAQAPTFEKALHKAQVIVRQAYDESLRKPHTAGFSETVGVAFENLDLVFAQCIPRGQALAKLNHDPLLIGAYVADTAAAMAMVVFAEGEGRKLLIALVALAYGCLSADKKFMEALQLANWKEMLERLASIKADTVEILAGQARAFLELHTANNSQQRQLDEIGRSIKQQSDKIDGAVQSISMRQEIRVTSPNNDTQYETASYLELSFTSAISDAKKCANLGDRRFKGALTLTNPRELLKLESAFKSVAQESERSIKSAKKNAATAFRSHGAIVAMSDPKRALISYKKAIVCDPEDMESILCIVTIERQYGTLSEMQVNFRRVLASSVLVAKK